MMYQRWAIFIDIEGFSYTHLDNEAVALRKLSKLLHDIFKIGNDIFFSDSDRLFAHQMGDSFLIVNNLASNKNELGRLISISVALMQSAILNDFVLKSAISHGDFADIKSLYPDEIFKDTRNGDDVNTGGGILRVFPVMGSVLIRTVSVHKDSRSGPVLSIDKDLASYIPDEYQVIFEDDNLIELNWLKTRNTVVDQIHHKISESVPESEELVEKLKSYLENPNLKEDWINSANDLIS